MHQFSTWTKKQNTASFFKTPPHSVGKRRLIQNKLTSSLYDSPVLLPDCNTTVASLEFVRLLCGIFFTFVYFSPALKILYTSISILIITGNTLVLLATWRDRSLHQPNKYFVACLAVADLLVGIFIGPAIVYGLSVDYKSLHDTSIHMCRFMMWIDTLAIAASVCTLVFISFDRYFKISKPLQYRFRMTTSKSFKIIFIIWLISTALATYSATPDSGLNGILISAQFNCRADNKSPSKRVALGTSCKFV